MRSRVREIRKHGSVGARGEKSPWATRPNFDWQKIPSYPATTSKSLFLVDKLQSKSYKAYILTGKKVEGEYNSGKIERESLFEIQEHQDGSILIRLYAYCDPAYNPHRLLSYQAPSSQIYSSAIEQEVIKCNSYIAQELFPPLGNSIQESTKTNQVSVLSSKKIYNWESMNGWFITIDENNVFFFLKKVKKSL
jgi:hypothetical protein